VCVCVLGVVCRCVCVSVCVYVCVCVDIRKQTWRNYGEDFGMLRGVLALGDGVFFDFKRGCR